MNFFLPFLGLVALANSSLALFVFSRNPRSWVNRSFVLFVGTLSFWTICIGLLFTFKTLLWSDLTLFFGNLVGVSSFILFSRHFPENQKLNIKYLFYFFILPIVIFLLLTPFRPFVSGIIVEADQIRPVLGPLYPLLMLWSIFGAGFGSYILFRKYRKSVGRPKSQLKYLFWGFCSFLIIVTLTGVILPAFGIGKFAFFSPAATLILFGLTSYAIIRHRLMDIRLVVALTVSYTLLVAVFGVFYSLFFAASLKVFVQQEIEVSTILVSSALAFIMAFTFQPLRRVIEKLTNKIFYKDQYSSSALLYKIALIMASSLRIEELTHGILVEVLQQLHISAGAFILLEGDKIFDVKSEGYQKTPVFDEDEVALLSKTKDTIIFDEYEENEIKKILRNLDLAVVVHIRSEGDQIGLLVLGNKLSGDIYSAQDLHLLDILAPEAAIAIQNAKAYEEIRRFNITLQDEVNKATSDLKSANVKLQELDHLKDEFVSLASHELRTPMTAIKGSISTILDGYAGAISKDAKEFLTAAYNENDRLLRLVNNLLNISRIEAGKFTFTIIKVDMNKLIEEVVHNLDPYAKEKSLFVKYDKTEENIIALADEDKVKEVLVNLIGNALKFTHQGGITVKAVKTDAMLTVSVQDTGSGIAKDDQDLLFKKFSQVTGKNYAKPTGGTGLGLYISKQIVEGLKGRIWLESTLGKGSTFYFTVPLASKKL